MIEVKCTKCGERVELGPLDPIADPFVCAECSKGHEGEPAEGEDEGSPVEIEELGADGAVIAGKVRF